jgi:hypothetical protein
MGTQQHHTNNQTTRASVRISSVNPKVPVMVKEKGARQNRSGVCSECAGARCALRPGPRAPCPPKSPGEGAVARGALVSAVAKMFVPVAKLFAAGGVGMGAQALLAGHLQWSATSRAVSLCWWRGRRPLRGRACQERAPVGAEPLRVRRRLAMHRRLDAGWRLA